MHEAEQIQSRVCSHYTFRPNSHPIHSQGGYDVLLPILTGFGHDPLIPYTHRVDVWCLTHSQGEAMMSYSLYSHDGSIRSYFPTLQGWRHKVLLPFVNSLCIVIVFNLESQKPVFFHILVQKLKTF